MPLYEYQCDACGIKMEKIRKFSDPPLEICEACGGHLQKLFSSPAIQFKGSGFYITDYAKKTSVEGASGSSSKSDSGKAADSAGKDSSSKDSSSKDSAAKSDTSSSSATSGDKPTGSNSKP